MDNNVSGQHISQVVAPLLAAFTLPTIAVIVVTPPPHWRYAILSLFVASAGLLLAGFQLSVGRLFRDATPWNEVRSILTFLGLITLTAGMALLAASARREDRTALFAALAILAAGVLVPIGMNPWLWKADGRQAAPPSAASGNVCPRPGDAPAPYDAGMNLLRSDPVLAVKDLDRSATWFVDVLGCDKTEPDPGNWAFCTAGNVTFMLGRCPDAIPVSELGDHSYVAYLTVDAVDGYYSRALAEKAEVLKPPTDQPWGRREMALRTPDGHRIMLSERT